MKNFHAIIAQYKKIKKVERLDYTQLRQRLEKDKFHPYQIRKILGEIYRQQENRRIGYLEKMNTIYPWVFGLLLVSASIYYYHLGGGTGLMEKSRGTGWNEYQYLVGMLLLCTTGISLLIHGWMQWKK